MAPMGLLMLADPVSGERLLGIEKLFDVVQNQVLQRAADERDVDLADTGESQPAAGVWPKLPGPWGIASNSTV
jgi:hypothetical protein